MRTLALSPKVKNWMWLGLAALSVNALLAGMVIVPAANQNSATQAALNPGGTISREPVIVTGPRTAVSALQQQLGAPIDALWNPVLDVPTWVFPQDAALRLPYVPTAAERGNPAAVARGFLDANRQLFGLGSVDSDLTVLRGEDDSALGIAHVRFQQQYKGLPVYGGQLVVHVDGADGVLGVNGQFRPDIALQTAPTIDRKQAEEIALRNLREAKLEPDEAADMRAQLLPELTQLVVYLNPDEKPTLAWMVKIFSTKPLGRWTFFVHARKGAVTHANEIGSFLKRRVTFTAQNSSDIPGYKLADEGEIPRDAIARAAHDGAGKVYDYFFSNFKRDSIDGRGMPLVSTVHWGESAEEAENAAWIGEAKQMVYGDGGRMFRPLATGLDVVGHEFTHGVVESTAGLIYEAQAGALNESFADVFGVLISGSNWEVGRAVVKSPPFPVPYLRSLSDPNANGYYNTRNPLGGVGQPKNMNEYANLPVSRRADNGGVHINSGIPNNVAYRVGTALGRDKLGQIWYRALANYMTPRSRFVDAANATIRAAQELYGAADSETVRKAWADVGIGGQASNEPQQAPAGGSTKPSGSGASTETVPAGCTNVVTNGGFESESNWTQLTKGSTGMIDTENPRNGQGSAWLGGQDQESVQAIYQDVTIPANATSVTFRYWRYAHEEVNSLFAVFAGPATFQAVIANPNSRARAEMDTLTSDKANDTWQQQSYDVSQLAGRTVRILFASENPRGNISSFFVDDVAVIACTASGSSSGSGTSTPSTPSAPQPTVASQVYLAGQIVDADTGRGVSGATVFVLKQGVTTARAAADDRISDDEIATSATTDARGVFQSRVAVGSGAQYSVIIVARGYRPVVADAAINVPANASNPHPVQAKMRRMY